MQVLERIARAIDRFHLGVGRLAAWLTLGMTLLGAYNAIARYLGRFVGTNLTSNALIELQWYLFSAVFLLGAAATLVTDGHVRVDVFYARLRARSRAWIDLVGTLVFLLPFALLAVALSWPALASSWAIREGSPDPGGLPRYPIKALIPLAFALLALQGIAHGARAFLVLRGRRRSLIGDGDPR
jgi:TRAP-type mannitol/chloroaromatic compound transport system permease small subunit